jgi:uncharacterized protein (DUF488 family)
MPPDTASPVLAGIGYEGHTVDELLEVLEANEVDVLVDVRQTPMSRKRGFSKRLLAEALAGRSIDYVHLPALGNPKDNRAAFHRDSSLARGRERYLAHLEATGRPAYDEVVALARARRAVLLCLEHDGTHCHRSCILDLVHTEHPDIPLLAL